MRCLVGLTVLAAALVGCGGHYILTVPDQVAPVGSKVVPVAQLHRNDFFVMDLAVKGALLRFRINGGGLRAAYTDKLGYAAALLAVPRALGRHVLSVDHMDFEGEEIAGAASVYAWPADEPVLAVDLNCLPYPGQDDAASAAAALRRLAPNGRILYLTREPVGRHERLHGLLDICEYPDGPVLLWQRQRWHIVREGRFRLRIVVESRLVSSLGELRKTFGGLRTGVCDSALAARAFTSAGLRCILVKGGLKLDAVDVARETSWSALAE